MKEGLFVLPFQRFLGMVSLVFSKFWHGARNPSEVVRCNAGFFKKKKNPKKTKQNWENRPKMDRRQGFLNSRKIFVIYFY